MSATSHRPDFRQRAEGVCRDGSSHGLAKRGLGEGNRERRELVLRKAKEQAFQRRKYPSWNTAHARFNNHPSTEFPLHRKSSVPAKDDGRVRLRHRLRIKILLTVKSEFYFKVEFNYIHACSAAYPSPFSLCPRVISFIPLLSSFALPHFLRRSFSNSLFLLYRLFTPPTFFIFSDYFSSRAVEPLRDSTGIPLLMVFIFIWKYLKFTGSFNGNYCFSGPI